MRVICKTVENIKIVYTLEHSARRFYRLHMLGSRFYSPLDFGLGILICVMTTHSFSPEANATTISISYLEECVKVLHSF